jgi:hypothetical protein
MSFSPEQRSAYVQEQYDKEIHELRAKNAANANEIRNLQTWLGALTEVLSIREQQVAGIKRALGEDAVQETEGTRKVRAYQRVLLNDLAQAERTEYHGNDNTVEETLDFE